MDIVIIKNYITEQQLKKLAEKNFGNMIKGVIDIERKIIALGGELHADAETVLLQKGCQQKNLWGFNIYTDQTIDNRLEYTSFINIRPSQGNNSLEIQKEELRKKIKRIIDKLIEGNNG